MAYNQEKLKLILQEVENKIEVTLNSLTIPYTAPSYNIKIGNFKTPYVQGEGIEWASTKSFAVGDDLKQVNTRSIKQMDSFYHDAIMGNIQVHQWTKYAEQDLVIILDISRSILSGIFHEPGIPTKLTSFFYTLTNLLSIGFSKRFKIRILLTRNGYVRQFFALEKEHTLKSLIYEIKHAWFSSLNEYQLGESEKLCLKSGLAELVGAKKSLVAIISDFLEPIDSYSSELDSLKSKHYLLLLDIAAPEDRCYPLPQSSDFYYENMPRWEGARDIEQYQLELRKNTKQKIEKWNQIQLYNYNHLTTITQRNKINIPNLYGLDTDENFDLIVESLRQI